MSQSPLERIKSNLKVKKLSLEKNSSTEREVGSKSKAPTPEITEPKKKTPPAVEKIVPKAPIVATKPVFDPSQVVSTPIPKPSLSNKNVPPEDEFERDEEDTKPLDEKIATKPLCWTLDVTGLSQESKIVLEKVLDDMEIPYCEKPMSTNGKKKMLSNAVCPVRVETLDASVFSLISQQVTGCTDSLVEPTMTKTTLLMAELNESVLMKIRDQIGDKLLDQNRGLQSRWITGMMISICLSPLTPKELESCLHYVFSVPSDNNGSNWAKHLCKLKGKLSLIHAMHSTLLIPGNRYIVSDSENLVRCLTQIKDHPDSPSVLMSSLLKVMETINPDLKGCEKSTQKIVASHIAKALTYFFGK